jgi:hypothetical protein
MYRASCTVYYLDEQMHNTDTHIYKPYFNIVSTTTCFDASASASGSLNFYFVKVTKIINFTH